MACENDLDKEAIELELFIEAVKRFVGYDLSGYARVSLKRRVKHCMQHEGLTCISALIPFLANHPEHHRILIDRLTVNVSEIFRDPAVFLSIKAQVLPYLETFPSLDIWVAGCANGEEAYSLAIFLAEAGLLARTRIHATDICTLALQRAKSGVLKHALKREDAQRYQQSGGKSSISQYFSTAYGQQKLSQTLLDHISFNHHDLVQEGIFCSAQLVLCRNVMIYLNAACQENVLQLLFDAVVDNGFLIIGPKEVLDFSPISKRLMVLDKPSRIYQRKAWEGS